MTDELADYGEGCWISEFVSAGMSEYYTDNNMQKKHPFLGPKQYSFIVRDRAGKIKKVVTKVKGFSLNHSTAAHINFKKMRSQVWNYVKRGKIEEVVIYDYQIKRTKTHEIVTEPYRKVQKVVYSKRVILSDFSSVPYGYIY